MLQMFRLPEIQLCYLFCQLLSKPKFSGIEKIKTIGSTYMVAAGLTPGLAENEAMVGEQ